MAILSDLFDKIFGRPTQVSSELVANPTLTKADLDSLARMGTTISGITQLIDGQVKVNYDRLSLYQECVSSLSHPIISAAVELYATSATAYNKENNSSVWISSDNSMYRETLTKLLERINIEDNIFDWAYAVAAYGDLFVTVNGQPKTGVLSVDSSKSPIEFYRIEKDGQLIGFYNQMYSNNAPGSTSGKLLPPWSTVQIKLSGARKRRPIYGDNYGYRTSIIGVGGNTFQESVAYGTPIIMPALPIYKRLRLCEDSLLMARASKGPLKYIFKVGMNSENIESAKAIIDSYGSLLKRSKSLNTNTGSEGYSDRLNNMTGNEDIILPVWGDVNQVAIEKLGGESDIKWVTDYEELRNLLATALGVPLQLLGGFSKDGQGSSLNPGNSLEKLDIRFSRSASRVQRALIQGITRICQIHLAYLGLDPDTKLFEVHMHNTSGAEDEQNKETLKTSIEAAGNLVDLMVKITGEQALDREKLFNVLNDRILKQKDLTYQDLIKDEPTATMSPTGELQTPPAEGEEEQGPVQAQESRKVLKEIREVLTSPDLYAAVPLINKPNDKFLSESEWKDLYGDVLVEIKKEG